MLDRRYQLRFRKFPVSPLAIRVPSKREKNSTFSSKSPFCVTTGLHLAIKSVKLESRVYPRSSNERPRDFGSYRRGF